MILLMPLLLVLIQRIPEGSKHMLETTFENFWFSSPGLLKK